MQRIAFDGQSSYGVKNGLGVYTTSVMNVLRQAAISNGMEVDFYPDPESTFACPLNTPRRLQWEILGFPAHVNQKKYALAHIPAFAMGWPKAKTVLTVHDLIGKAFPNQAGLPSRFYWNQWLGWAARRADHLIADSEHTRQDLIRLLRIHEKKITLIYPAGHEGFRADISVEEIKHAKEKFGLKGSYFVFVGTFEPRKNLPRVLEAFKIFLKAYPSYQLVLIGSSEFAHGRYMQALTREQALDPESVLTPGFIDHANLNALYCGAQALVFPSLYEGFGIPILEAMASGCPVITSNVTSPPEVAGEAGILVDPYKVSEISNAMISLAGHESLRSEMRLRGFQQIKKFSWTTTAQKIINLYKTLL